MILKDGRSPPILSDTDIVARIGGDEFVVLLPETPPEEAEAVAQRIGNAIPRSVRRVAGEPITLGVSVGCVCFDGSTPDAPDELLHAADEAMYRVKASRRA